MLSISTSFYNHEISLTDWLTTVKSYGYEAIELSYKITQSELNEAKQALNNLGLKVSSIHNFCPTPDDGPSNRHVSNYYRLSSIDEEERCSAVKWTKRACETARELGAPVVVIHAGTLDFEDERSPYLFKLFKEGKVASDEFSKEKKRILGERRNRKAPYIAMLEKSLEELVKFALEKNVIIGLETRYYPIEIPDFEEIGYFLNMYSADVLGYWHDVGHAEINSRLGITPHAQFLKTYGDRLVGVHIHGMKEARDHLAPFEGDMDIGPYLSYFKDPVIKVVESKPFADQALMKEAVKKLVL